LLDVFTAGDVVYLLAYTNLVDGAGAFCDPDFCFIQPATGQVATPAGFAAVDFPHTGYVIRSNPAHPSGQGFFSTVDKTYGLETIRIVFDAAQEDGDIRLRQMWRSTGVVPVWQTFGDRRFLDTVAQGQYERHEGIPKHREVTVYDANGIALRFWGERRPDGSWRYNGLQGVFSRLVENADRPGEFYLLGGPPGAMHEKGSWLYIFDVVRPVDNRFSGRGAYLKLLVDPAGNKVWVDSSLSSDGTAYLAYQPTDLSSPLQKIARESGTLKYYSSRFTGWLPFGRVGSGLVEWGHRDVSTIDLTVNWWGTDSTTQIGNRSEKWTMRLFDSREALPFAHQYNSDAAGYRLHTRQVGNLKKTTYDYGWHDLDRNPSRSQFTITAQQEGKRPKWLSYKVRSNDDPQQREFEEVQQLLPSLSNASVYERTVYRFNTNGQIDWVRFFSSRFDQQPRWETQISYNTSNPSLIDSVTFTDFASRRSFTTHYTWKTVPVPPVSWMGREITRGSEWVLGGVQDPTGVRVNLLYPHEVGDTQSPPVAPVRVLDGAGNEARLEYHPDGRLKRLWEPGRTNPWQLEYYPDTEPDDYYRGRRRLMQVTDPTGRSLFITQYDPFGRPTRMEVRPNSTTTLWQEVEWNLLGLPREVRWSDGSSVSLDWQQGHLARVRDARNREARFVRNHRLGSHLLSAIFVSNQLFARLDYDDYGRLTRVAGGNGVGVSYGYDDPAANDPVGERDVLRWVHYDGDSARERFTYRCCGELERWTKPDGRWANFTFEAGLLTQVTTSDGQVYSYRYDDAGRLKHAQNSISQSSWVYEYEVGVNTGRLHSETTTLPAGTYSHRYTCYPDSSVETATLTIGSFSRQLRYVYDDAGRLTNIFYNNQPLASYDYDGAGRLKSQTVYPFNTTAQLNATLTYADTQSVGALGTLHWQWNTSTLAFFDYRGFDNQPGYYPDGTLARARDQVAGQTYLWEWEYDALGQLAYEKRRVDNGEWEQTNFTYDTGGNLWGNAGWVYRFNQLVYVPRTELNNNWYFAYTPNGERWRWWTTDRGEALQGDVNRDGQVDDSDLLAVQFAFGRTDCPCPEDVNGDGVVDDGDLMEVLFNFGQSAGGVVSWEYAYDVWGNLVEAFSPAAGRYRALYDALGRRVGQEIVRDTGATQLTYYVYEGDTIVAEVDGSGRLVAEYVWGLLGPIVRIDYRRPEDTRYYVIDGLGHVRALVAPNGAITEVWHYDSWGNPISPPAQRIDQPFLWNGAYGWTYTPFTGLYHLNPDYDPRTGRYLQRQGSNPTNPYIAQENDPINNIDENLSLGGTQGLLQRGLPKDQQQQLVGTLKASGQFVAELHPGVLATEAAYGRDCYGEQLSALERMGAAVGAVGGGLFGRLGQAASRGIQTLKRGVQALGRVAGQLREGAEKVAAEGLAQVRTVVRKVATAFQPKVPEEAEKILQYLKAHNWTPPRGYKGGRVFQNREGKLPACGNYREYDIHPYVKGQNRGSERIVVDINTGRAWYTPDHYQTFIEIRK
jgi:YD repeat-containing protein